MKNIKFLIAGVFFGLLLSKAEIISWYRIQEMFRFQSFHMYGVIGSAVAVGIISVQIIKILKLKTIDGEPIKVEFKKFNKGFVIGGFLFGVGWALTGACPGPLYAQVGTGYLVVLVSILFAIMGTFTYGALKEKLPH
jgi:uncharacterized membrane protein YedE/YeeE